MMNGKHIFAAHLAGLTSLVDLFIHDLPNLKGPGLKHLQKLTQLRGLLLSATGITDEGWANIMWPA